MAGDSLFGPEFSASLTEVFYEKYDRSKAGESVAWFLLLASVLHKEGCE